MQIHLPIATLHIHSGEPFGSSERVQSVVDLGQWKAVPAYDIAQLPLVHAEGQVLFFFGREPLEMTKGSLTLQ
jgi:hypothetical protein